MNAEEPQSSGYNAKRHSLSGFPMRSPKQEALTVMGARRSVDELLSLGVVSPEAYCRHSLRDLQHAIQCKESQDFKHALHLKKQPRGISRAQLDNETSVVVTVYASVFSEEDAVKFYEDNKLPLGSIIPCCDVKTNEVHTLYIVVPVQFENEEKVLCYAAHLLYLAVAPNTLPNGKSWSLASKIDKTDPRIYPWHIASNSFTLYEPIDWPNGNLRARIAKSVFYYELGRLIPTSSANNDSDTDNT